MLSKCLPFFRRKKPGIVYVLFLYILPNPGIYGNFCTFYNILEDFYIKKLEKKETRTIVFFSNKIYCNYLVFSLDLIKLLWFILNFTVTEEKIDHSWSLSLRYYVFWGDVYIPLFTFYVLRYSAFLHIVTSFEKYKLLYLRNYAFDRVIPLFVFHLLHVINSRSWDHIAHLRYTSQKKL